ncbi:MAG: ribonuclease D [Pseudomonadota bacterium]
MAIHIHKNDLPDDLDLGSEIAVDTEAMGLVTGRDRLCVVQVSDGRGDEHLVQIEKGQTTAPNLVRILSDRSVLKLFHFARFDIVLLQETFGVVVTPIYCTKIASRLARTYTDRHGLKDLARELISVDISKQQQSSDWGADTLSDAQKEYAASDVRYLHRIRDVLSDMLEREGRMNIAQACFDFLPTRAAIDLAGWPDTDIFAHS